MPSTLPLCTAFRPTFDAVKIALTATPAQHTTQIFGKPVYTYTYTYTYQEAVIDGWLADHLPPIRLRIALAQELVPLAEEKTLVFCANDAHADLVVQLLSAALVAAHGEQNPKTVQKITGRSDKPELQIRLFKNEALPKMAVTVDLLSTGIDVPRIANIGFLRRVRSRILYEQMLGRATRPCPEIGKEHFRIFDAVDIYAALDGVNTMRPVVLQAGIPLAQLMRELLDPAAATVLVGGGRQDPAPHHPCRRAQGTAGGAPAQSAAPCRAAGRPAA